MLRIEEPFAEHGRGFWAKLEGFNPGGMRPACAAHGGTRPPLKSHPGGAIIESTSGTLGLGLALCGHVRASGDLGDRSRTGTDLVADARRIRRTGRCRQRSPSGRGWQQARRDRVRTLLERDEAAWCPDQYSNPDNVTGYRASWVWSLTAQLRHIDVLVLGGHRWALRPVWLILCGSSTLLEVVGVDTIGSTISPAGTVTDYAGTRLEYLPPQRCL